MNAALSYIWSLPWWAVILIGAVCLGVLLVIVSAIWHAFLLVAEQLLTWAWQFVHWLSSLLSAGMIAVLRGLGRGLRYVLALIAWPFLWVSWQVTGALSVVAAKIEDYIDEQKELRRLWKEDYRDQFKTFREFKQAFNEGRTQGPRGAESSESPRTADPFIEACRLLGLPETGEFSEKDLDRKYRRFMNVVHQDKDGSHELATMVNTSRDVVKQRKGWA